jgi:membrane protein
LVVILLAVFGLFFRNQDNQALLRSYIREFTGGTGAASGVESLLGGAQAGGSSLWASLLSVVTLVLGATGLFLQVKESLNTIWDAPKEKAGGIVSKVVERGVALLLVVGIGLLMVALVLLSTVLSAVSSFASDLLPGGDFIWSVVDFLITFGVLTGLFAVLYKVLPDVDIAWREVWLGAAVTAVLFTLGKLVIGIYLGRRGLSDVYGAAGSLIAVLLWVYYSAQIFLIGAEFTQVYASRDREFEPAGKAASYRDRSGKTKSVSEPRLVPTRVMPVPVTGQEEASPTQTLPPAGAPIATISAVLAGLAGFVSGWLLNRPGSR